MCIRDRDYPIASNDDAIRAIRLFTRAISDAYMAGAALHKESFNREHASTSKAPVDVIVRKGGEEENTASTEAAEAPAPAAEETAGE